jgi:hypothetical protein
MMSLSQRLIFTFTMKTISNLIKSNMLTEVNWMQCFNILSSDRFSYQWCDRSHYDIRSQGYRLTTKGRWKYMYETHSECRYCLAIKNKYFNSLHIFPVCVVNLYIYKTACFVLEYKQILNVQNVYSSLLSNSVYLSLHFDIVTTHNRA